MRSPVPAVLIVQLVMAAAAPAQTTPAAAGDTSIFRPLDLPTPNQYRLASGEPGPKYWQQRADYQIRATLDTATQTLTGSETIRYRNNSPSTLRYIWVQVDQNLYRPGSEGSFLNSSDARWGGRSFAGGYDIRAARVGGAPVRPYIHDTMMRLDLPRPLAPGGTISIDLEWSFLIPEYGSDRMARQGALYEMAQWFPRMAVFDDVRGWNTDPYLGQGEFYREFGDYDVALTVPASFVVAATGTLRNPAEVLTATQRVRLARAARDTAQVAIITAAEAGTAAARPRATGVLTWRFRAENVQDFAWAASPRFRWDSESWNGVRCHAFYQPDATAWTTAADMTCFSIREFSTRWFPYPWPQATSVAGPVGGMEYPMFSMVHASGDEYSVFSTILHEQGHEWFPMIVGSNERRYTWMDEGFNTFIDRFGAEVRYPTDNPRYTGAFFRQAYEQLVARGGEQPLITPPDRVAPSTLGVTGYRKPAMVLNLLRDQVLDPATFDLAFRTYIQRWAYKHPTPADFFRTMEDVAGRDLSWFWREWVFSTETLDIGVAEVRQAPASSGGGVEAEIVLTTNPRMVMPITLRVWLENGETREVRLPVEVWYGGPRYSFRAQFPGRVVGVMVDPRNALPDRNRTNNMWGTVR